MASILKAASKFFGVAVRGQTYLNALFLLLAFPLGLIYFIFLVVGISVGLPLIILWVGLLILALVFAAWVGLIGFERNMAKWLLHEKIPLHARPNLAGKNLWQKFTTTISDPITWKGLVYLLAKLPLGVLSFSVLVTLGSISLSLLAAPIYYKWIQPQITITLVDGRPWMINSLSTALLVSLLGVLVTLVSMHILNGMAWVSGKFARVMLGNLSSTPQISGPIAITLLPADGKTVSAADSVPTSAESAPLTVETESIPASPQNQ